MGMIPNSRRLLFDNFRRKEVSLHSTFTHMNLLGDQVILLKRYTNSNIGI